MTLDNICFSKAYSTITLIMSILITKEKLLDERRHHYCWHSCCSSCQDY